MILLGLLFMCLCILLAAALCQLTPSEISYASQSRMKLNAYYVADGAMNDARSYLEQAFYNTDRPGTALIPINDSSSASPTYVPAPGRSLYVLGSSSMGDYAPHISGIPALTGKAGELIPGWGAKVRLTNLTLVPTGAATRYTSAFRIDAESYFYDRLKRRISAVVIQDSLLRNMLYVDTANAAGVPGSFLLPTALASGTSTFDGPVTVEGSLSVNTPSAFRFLSQVDVTVPASGPTSSHGVNWPTGIPTDSALATVFPNTGSAGLSSGVLAPVADFGAAQYRNAKSLSGDPEGLGDRDPINDLQASCAGSGAAPTAYGVHPIADGGIYVEAVVRTAGSATTQSASVVLGVSDPNGRLYNTKASLDQAVANGLLLDSANQTYTIGLSQPLVAPLAINFGGVTLPVGNLLTAIPLVDQVVYGLDSAVVAARTQSLSLNGTFNVINDFPVTVGGTWYVRVTEVPTGHLYRGLAGPVTVVESLSSLPTTDPTTLLTPAPSNVAVFPFVPAQNLLFCDGQIQGLQGVALGQLTVASSNKVTVSGSISLARTASHALPLVENDSMGIASPVIEIRMDSNYRATIFNYLFGNTGGAYLNNLVNGLGAQLTGPLTGTPTSLTSVTLTNLLSLVLTPPGSVTAPGEGTAANPFQLYASLEARQIDYRMLTGSYLDQVGSMLLFSQAGSNTAAPTTATNSSLLSSLTYTSVVTVLRTAGSLLDPLLGLSTTGSANSAPPHVTVRYNVMQRFSPPPRFGRLPQFIPQSYRDEPVQ